MNLHQIVSGAIAAVNPLITASIQVAGGYTTAADGSRTEGLATAVPVDCQVQSLQYNDIAQLDGLNIQGTRRKIYMNGNWNGLVRPTQQGGDLITMPDGTVYLVVMVLEHWPDWTSVAVTLQNGA